MVDPPIPDKTPGKIVTFYSYKGGTGRSLALANVAWLLAANGHSVLVIDWDLEAPGLHRYLGPFLRDPELTQTRGVMELLWDYANLVLTPREAWPSSVETPTDLADVRPYVVPLENPFADAGGSLHFLCAGQQVTAYAGRFRDFDWRALYERQGGSTFFDKLSERLRSQYNFVLIDSRTGVADTSGICTVQLPDEVVLCFTYNRQSVRGVAAVAQSIHSQRTPPPTTWPVPMRVEKGIEGLNEARDFAREELDRFLPADWTVDDRARYWDSCEIAYYPDYAIGEALAVFRDRLQTRGSLIADMHWLASRLVPAHHGMNFPSLNPERRDTILRRYRLRDPRKAKLAELLAQPPSSVITTQLLSLVGEALESAVQDIGYQAALAQALTKAVKASGLDQPEAAQSLALATTEIYRRLAQSQPDDFLPGLANSLNDLGASTFALSRREEALAATQEAVDIFRRLAQSRPDAFLPDLAGSLHNLGRRLSALGRREEALAATQEAVDIKRRLAQSRPDAFLPDLATSLNSLGNDLSDLGCREEALAATQEAVEIRRLLAQSRPDAFLPDLASSLHNIGNRLSSLGRREEALDATQEAVNIRRRLAQNRPDAFLSDLAGSLNNLGNALSDFGRREEALAATQEAVDIRRRLVQNRPETFLPDLAGNLNNLGNRLSALGRHEEALVATQDAVDIYRRLAQSLPDAFAPNLARSLKNRGNRLSALGCREEALTSTQEAVDIFRRLAQSRPDTFLPDLAGSLNNFGNALSDLGRREEALDATQEAVDIRRRLAQTRPETFLPDLAKSLGTLGRALAAAERHADAAAADHEGLTTIAPFVERHPQVFAELTRTLTQSYISASEKSGTEPDQALLARVLVNGTAQ